MTPVVPDYYRVFILRFLTIAYNQNVMLSLEVLNRGTLTASKEFKTTSQVLNYLKCLPDELFNTFLVEIHPGRWIPFKKLAPYTFSC